jgi:spermidine synthase
VTHHGYDTVLEAERTFFGAYHVSLDPQGKFHELYHGTTLHGLEAVDPGSRGEPLVYYLRSGPVGQAFSRIPRLRDASDVAVVGLGVGSLAAYANDSQRWTFYEIDPVVERIARDRRYFHFLESCGSRCDVVLGDARLSLARSTNDYDAIVLDAFSSDAIPVHLLTREAVNIYRQRLKPGGVLLFHVSNRYLGLAPALERLFDDAGLMAVEQTYQVDAAEMRNGKSASEWIVASSDSDAIRLLFADPRWHALPRQQRLRVWTDDYSNVLGVLRLPW